MLREARTLATESGRTNIDFVAADAECLPFAAGSFDRVTCRIAPHHFPDLAAAISEFVRVARPGGLVGIIDSVVPEDPALDAFINGIEKVRDPTHVRSYRVEEWVSLLKDAGLSLVHACCAWKEHRFREWVERTGVPPAVQREVEEMFLGAFPRAREFFRVRVEGDRVAAYSDEKGIFVGCKE
jgi:ubiquinone/menaquinone biosynthesis C-methylase UbiE